MREEIKSIEKNGTWWLINLPVGKKSIGVKWVFKRKLKPDGSFSKYKARLVANGFLQRQGLDFTEVFAPVARMKTIRLVVTVACARCWSLFHLYVKSAFLHGPLEEEVYVQQPPRFVDKGIEHQVYKLQKALYGLRQSPRAWNKHIDLFLLKLNFTRCVVEHGVYVKGGEGEELLIIYLYVDDVLITGSNPRCIDELKRVMQSEFEMTDLGKLSYFLGMEFTYTIVGLILHQKKYVKELLERFGMTMCNSARSPIEVNQKLVNNENEEDVEETMFK